MEIMIWSKGLSFQGKVTELRRFLATLPQEQKLADYLAEHIKNNFH